MATSKFSRESVSAAIACAVNAVGVEKLIKVQDLAIESFKNGEDVFVALPTGYGKSILLHVAAADVRQPSKESVQLDRVVCVTA